VANSAFAGLRLAGGTTSDVIANLPAAGLAGRLYLPTDAPVLLRDTGAAWASFAPYYPLTPPRLSALTKIAENAGDSTTQPSPNGPVYQVKSNQLGMMLYSFVKPLPGAPPYDLRLAFTKIDNGANYSNTGLTVTDGPLASNKQALIYWSNSYGCWCNHWNNANSGGQAADPGGIVGGVRPSPAAMVWLRITDDGSNRKYWCGMDNFNWMLVCSEPTNTFLTPTHFGLVCGNNSGQVIYNVYHHLSP
jgi:hypothetical protein